MSYSEESDWSESEDGLDQLQTSVLLGLPDGDILDPKDLRDPNVSRLGGKPGVNEDLEELSVRAFRQLRFNDKYAAKLEKRQQKAKEKEDREKAKAAASSLSSKANPFSMGSTGATGGVANVFGGGFGTENETTNEDNEDLASGGSEDDYDYEEENEGRNGDDAEVGALAAALTNTSITTDPKSNDELVRDWDAAPSYPALYLNTTFEYISPPKPDADKKAKKDGGKAVGAEMWDLEQYERATDVDEVFQKFASRVAEEGTQCIRYELGGTPLPFHTDDIYKKLFPPAPIAPGTAIPVTNVAHAVSAPPPPRPTYDPSIVAACGHCGGVRVFECQLMPNIINLLKRKQTGSDNSEEARKKLIAAALGGQGGLGMEWGTCMVFACKEDCCDGRECWREEEVLIQWEK